MNAFFSGASYGLPFGVMIAALRTGSFEAGMTALLCWSIALGVSRITQCMREQSL